jgi:hypothetical protein
MSCGATKAGRNNIPRFDRRCLVFELVRDIVEKDSRVVIHVN